MTTEALKILAIDDNPDNLLTLKAVVRDALPGAVVVTALNGPQGIALARGEDPDVILLDIVMPGMDGYAVCRRLKEDLHTQPIPVIFLTALRADRASRVQALEAGAEAFLSKPLDEVELIAQIRAMAKVKAANQMQRLEREGLAALVAERTAELEQELAARKRVEETLRLANQRLTLAQQSAGAGLWDWDIPTGKLNWSAELFRLFGLDPSRMEASFDVWRCVLHPDDREAAEAQIYAAIKDHVPLKNEYRIVLPTGEIRWISALGDTMFDDQGQMLSMSGICLDITEHKRAEAELHRANRFLDTIIENIPNMIFLKEAEDLRFVRLNRAGENLLGLSREEMLGKNDHDFFPQEEAIFFSQKDRQVLQDKVIIDIPEETIQTRFQGGRILHTKKVPILNANGEPEYLLGISEDITERKRVEQDYQTLFSKMLEGFAVHEIICDEQGRPADYRFLTVNPAFEHITGLKAENIIGRTVLEVLPGTERHWIETYGQVALTGEPAIFEDYSVNLDKHFEVTAFRPAPSQFACIFTDITERKQAEAARQESEERYRALFENVSVGVALISPRMEILTLNRRMREWFPAITPEQHPICYRAFNSPPRDECCTYCPTRWTLADGQWHEAVTETPTPNGIRHYRVAATALTDADGKVVAAIEMVDDITERKLTEEALRESENTLQKIFDILPIGLWFADKDGRLLRGNPTGVAIWGAEPHVSPADYGVFKARRLLSGQEIAPDDWALAHTIREGVTVVDELLEIDAFDGKKKIVLNFTAPILDEHGMVQGAIVVNQDITARALAEAERARLLVQVQAQAQQIAQIMDAVPEGVLLLDADGRVLLANPVAERDLVALAGAVVGDQLTHLAGRPLAELLAAPPPGLWHEVQVDGHTFEIVARLITGGLEAERWVLVIDDVTQAHAVREQLQQQERLAAVGQLAAGIAHDFNNILAIIALQAPLIARTPGLAEHDRERLAVISEQTGQATRLIQQLLDFSRRAVLERRPLDLGPLLKEQVKLLARTLPETIQVTLAAAPDEYVVLADPTRLQQMLMNLAVNARDAMPGGGHLRLTLARQETAPRPDLPAGPWVRLTVTDSGTGLAPAAQAHLFEPFFTTKPRGQGTGLGLAQVHGIVKQHDGEIVVQSETGRGTTFTIYLPGMTLAAVAPAAAVVAPQAGAAQLILVVEDNPMLLDAMCDTVEMLGYRVIRAGNGVEALAVLAEHSPAIALVLSDLVMPVMGGEALFRAMRARGLTTPVAMLSGHPLEGELAELKTQGLAGWLLKPPELTDLARLLAQALGV